VSLIIQDNTGVLIKLIVNHMSLRDLVLPVGLFDVPDLDELN